MAIIDFMLAPAQIMIRGPSATLGRELRIVKNGSNTLDENLFHQRNKRHQRPNRLKFNFQIHSSNSQTHKLNFQTFKYIHSHINYNLKYMNSIN